MKLKITVAFLLCFSSYFSSAQSLELNDILSLHAMDSLTLNAFCELNGFALTGVSRTKFRNAYDYQSIKDKKISLSRTFSAGKDGNVFLHYHFNDKKEYKKFRNAMKPAGFTIVREYQTFPMASVYWSNRERFRRGDLELELGTMNYGPSNYVLLLYYHPKQ